MVVRRQPTFRHYQPIQVEGSNRRGSMALAAMMSLLVIIGGVAVALDRLWLDNAQTELEAAVEAAALRGGQFLASDDLLRLESDIDARLELARHEAGRIADKNLIAGESVKLNTDADGDIRFGRLVHRERTGADVFLETTDRPTTVAVRGTHSRSRNNPVAMFLNSVSGRDGADVSALSEASIDNHVFGLRPLAGVPVPVLPIAILRDGGQDRSSESWESQIENRQGADVYGFDEQTGEITKGPDGIPEIRVRSAAWRGNPEEANVHLFVLNSSATIEQLVSHVLNGWNEQDMPSHLTELRFDQGPHEFKTVNGINGPTPSAIEQLLGECRILFLYDEFSPEGRSGAGRIQVTRAVAGRILSIKEIEDDISELIIQPGVMTTRTAQLAPESSDSTASRTQRLDTEESREKLANRYIYKLQITN